MKKTDNEDPTQPTEPDLQIVTQEKPEKIKESKDPIGEIIARRITIGENADSMKLDPNTPMEELLPLVDYYSTLADKSRFIIGDLLNQAYKVHKEKLALIMHQTGRSMHTLEAYASVAKAIPASMRRPELSWSHYQQLAAVANNEEAGGKEKVKELAKRIVDEGTEGKPLTIKETKRVIEAEIPKKKPKKPDAKKPGRKAKPPKAVKAPAQKEARVMTAEEQAAFIDLTTHKLQQLNDALTVVMTILDSTPTKGDLTLLEAIHKAPKRDRKILLESAPDKGTINNLFRVLQGIEDKTGY